MKTTTFAKALIALNDYLDEFYGFATTTTPPPEEAEEGLCGFQIVRYTTRPAGQENLDYTLWIPVEPGLWFTATGFWLFKMPATPPVESVMQAHQYLYYVKGTPVISDQLYDHFCSTNQLEGGGGSDRAADYSDEVIALAIRILNHPHEYPPLRVELLRKQGPIVLPLESAHALQGECDEFIHHPTLDGEWGWTEFPELAPSYDCYADGKKTAGPGSFIVELSGIRYRAFVKLDDWSAPYQGANELILTPTEEPTQAMTLTPLKKAGQDDPKELEYFAEEHLPKYYAGHGDLRLYGQPDFIQGEVKPAHQGHAFRHLATLYTDWGDCGNINLFIWLDENGIPAKACMEASCA